MKKLTFTLFSIFLASMIYAQNTVPEIGEEWNVYLTKDNAMPLTSVAVEATAIYKDGLDNEIYRETHMGTTNESGYVRFVIGDGSNQVGELSAESFKSISRFCYVLEFEDEGEMRTIENEQLKRTSGTAAYAALAGTSENALRIRGVAVDLDSPLEAPVDTQDVAFLALHPDNTGGGNDPSIGQAIVGRIYETTTSPGQAQAMAWYHIPFDAPLHHLFGNTIPETLNSIVKIEHDNLDGIDYGLSVIVDKSSNDGNPTAAIDARNTAELGLGANIEGSVLGALIAGNQGLQSYMFSTSFSGSAVFGSVENAPADGEVHAAGLFNSNDLASTWAVFGNGPSGGVSAWSSASDRRLKKNIRNVSNMLEKVMQLKPRSYEFIQQSGRSVPKGTQIGFIAQEVEDLFPEVVTDIPIPEVSGNYPNRKMKALEYKGIQYGGLVPVLTGAIQELNQTVEQQQDEIDDLKAQVEELKQLIKEKE